MKNLCFALFLLLITIVVTADPPDPNQYLDTDSSSVGNCYASTVASRYVNGPFPNGTTDWWCQSSASHKGTEDVKYVIGSHIQDRIRGLGGGSPKEKKGTFHGDGSDSIDNSVTLGTSNINWSTATARCGGANAVASQVEDVLPWDPIPLPSEINNNLGISSSDLDKTPQPGDSVTLNLGTSEAFYSVSWYVHTPSDTSSSGTYLQDSLGDGTSTSASLSYTFPSGAMHTGDYLFRAYIWRWSDMSWYGEETYTVSVSE